MQGYIDFHICVCMYIGEYMQCSKVSLKGIITCYSSVGCDILKLGGRGFLHYQRSRHILIRSGKNYFEEILVVCSFVCVLFLQVENLRFDLLIFNISEGIFIPFSMHFIFQSSVSYVNFGNFVRYRSIKLLSLLFPHFLSLLLFKCRNLDES